MAAIRPGFTVDGSPFQVGGHKPRSALSIERVTAIIDAVTARRIRLMDRLQSIELFPRPGREGMEYANPSDGDHVLIQVLFEQAKLARSIPDAECEAKSVALRDVAKSTLAAIQESNAASTELQRIWEHNEKMALARAKQSGQAQTLAELMAEVKAADAEQVKEEP